jgi:hypothetical protein
MASLVRSVHLVRSRILICGWHYMHKNLDHLLGDILHHKLALVIVLNGRVLQKVRGQIRSRLVKQFEIFSNRSFDLFHVFFPRWLLILTYKFHLHKYDRGHRGRDRMVVGFTTTCTISVYHYLGLWVRSPLMAIQHYVIKLISDLRKTIEFLRVLRFPPPIKLTATI